MTAWFRHVLVSQTRQESKLIRGGETNPRSRSLWFGVQLQALGPAIYDFAPHFQAYVTSRTVSREHRLHHEGDAGDVSPNPEGEGQGDNPLQYWAIFFSFFNFF